MSDDHSQAPKHAPQATENSAQSQHQGQPIPTVHVELSVAGQETPLALLVASLSQLRDQAASHFDGDAFELYERDADHPLKDLSGRKAISVVAHRCSKVRVSVAFDREIHDDFPPSATVNKVLQWAVGKKGFRLDDDQQAKANLMLVGAADPLPREALIGQYVSTRTCNIDLVLTLKDFTNGWN